MQKLNFEPNMGAAIEQIALQFANEVSNIEFREQAEQLEEILKPILTAGNEHLFDATHAQIWGLIKNLPSGEPTAEEYLADLEQSYRSARGY
jgi:hypothetical protein